jgi:protein phosphatase
MKMALAMEMAGGTHVGLVRKNNEDTYALAPELNLAVVADGMGGAACGEVASTVTVETLLDAMRTNGIEQSPLERLKEAIRLGNEKVRAAAAEQANCQGMGSTIVTFLLTGETAWIANVGDSRAYRFREGELEQLSYDQSVANELRNSLGLSDEQIARYPQRNALTMAIGCSTDVLIRTHEEAPQADDLILLCSDGLYGPLGNQRIASYLETTSELEVKVQELIHAAMEHGGPDNITAVLLRFSSSAEPVEESA